MKKFFTMLCVMLVSLPVFAVELDLSTGVNKFNSEFDYSIGSTDYSIDSSADFYNVSVVVKGDGPGNFFWTIEGEFSFDEANISSGNDASFSRGGLSLGYNVNDAINGKLTLQRTNVDVGSNEFANTDAVFVFEQTMFYDDNIDVIIIYGGGVTDNKTTFAGLDTADSMQAGYLVGFNIAYHLTESIDFTGFINHKNYRDVRAEETNIADARFDQHDISETFGGLKFVFNI